jgi:hypothetical protein
MPLAIAGSRATCAALDREGGAPRDGLALAGIRRWIDRHGIRYARSIRQGRPCALPAAGRRVPNAIHRGGHGNPTRMDSAWGASTKRWGTRVSAIREIANLSTEAHHSRENHDGSLTFGTLDCYPKSARKPLPALSFSCWVLARRRTGFPGRPHGGTHVAPTAPNARRSPLISQARFVRTSRLHSATSRFEK